MSIDSTLLAHTAHQLQFLPTPLQNSIHKHLYRLAGSPKTNDLSWGRSHIDDDPVSRQTAIVAAIHEHFDLLGSEEKDKVKNRMWRYSGAPKDGDPDWGGTHVKDIDKIITLMWSLSGSEPSEISLRLDPTDIGFPKAHSTVERKLYKIARLFLNGHETAAIGKLRKAILKGTVPESVQKLLHKHYWEMCLKPLEDHFGRKFELKTDNPGFKAKVIVDFVRKGMHWDDTVIEASHRRLQAYATDLTTESESGDSEYVRSSRLSRNLSVAHITQWDKHPYDATLVHLSDGTFISANTVFSGRYILTQTPVVESCKLAGGASNRACTVEAFWQMADEKSVSCIVMLNGEPHSHWFRYFPWDTIEGREQITFGPRTIKLLERTEYKFPVLGDQQEHSVTDRKLLLCSPKGEEVLHHIKANHWGDFTPGDEATVMKIKELELAALAEKEGPILVHCRAGVGRTGHYAIYSKLYEDARAGKSYNIEDALYELRDPKRGRCPEMVQSLGQFKQIAARLRNLEP